MMENYELYVIISQFDIKETVMFLRKNTNDKRDIGPLRKDPDRDPKTKGYLKNNRKIILLREKLYLRLRDSGYNGEKKDFYIKPYIISENDSSRENVSTMNYYFPTNKGKENKESITERMEYYSKINLINENEWYVHDDGICEISNTVDKKSIIQIKIMLDNPALFRVSWCRNNLFQKLRKHFS